MLEDHLAKLSACMQADQERFRRRVRKLERARRNERTADGFAALLDEIDRSIQIRERRRSLLPRPTFPPELPVSQRREAIAEAIAAHQVTVVCGETGSGKTTQIPKICLELGRGVGGMIGHTQPRRIAARSVAARIAEELGPEHGAAVGYKVRFKDHVTADGYIKLMTDGILLAEIQGDRFLNAYDTLIIDEAHERSLNIDFLLGYLKQLLPKRPDLKLVITSATIDPERFARHFDDAPIIEVSGRTYPVEVRYRALRAEGEDEREGDQQRAILDAVDELTRAPGDILVFLAGEREIRDTAEALRKHCGGAVEVLPLYTRLSVAEQDRVFAPHERRRIVLATNVAETSLTVPNIHYVIDPGYARISRYSYRTKVQLLPIEPISRAAADQRKGRCGRLGPGVCVRLYAEEDFEQRPEFIEPELLRTSLAAAILQMKSLRLGDIEAFPFIDPPDRRYISDGYRLLRELGAIDAAGGLTPLGHRLARLPIDPRHGRMLLEAADHDCLAEMLVITSALSIQDPRERPLDARDAARAAHARFHDRRSDFIGFLNLWRFYHEQARHLSHNKLRKLCREHFLSPARMREWVDLHRQLGQLARELGMRPNSEPAGYAQVHRALLTGLLSHVGHRSERFEYRGARGARFVLSPGSGLHRGDTKGTAPKWVVAAELAQTRRLYAHCVAQIRPEWIERAAKHLISRSVSEPFWDEGRGEVMAHERLTLYGLTLVSHRRTRFAPEDPVTARAIFVQCALVEGRYQCRGEFLRHNQSLIAELRELEQRCRRPHASAGEAAVYAFYDARLPEHIDGGKAFEAWRRRAEKLDPQCLYLRREALIDNDDSVRTLFPDTIAVDGQVLPLEYRFEPGQERDGVSVKLPAAVLNQVDPHQFDRLVPGMLREKVIALLRTLPKSLRRRCVPLPDFAERCLADLGDAVEPLPTSLGRRIERITKAEVPAEAWDAEKLPPHLRMNYRVVDGAGVVLGEGRDLSRLQRKLRGAARAGFRKLLPPGVERDNITAWDFGDLPAVVDYELHGTRLQGYPALVDAVNSVSLRLLDSPQEAAEVTRGGLRRLYMLQLPKEMRYLRKHLPDLQAMCLRYATLPPAPTAASQGAARAGGDRCAELREQLIFRIVDRTFIDAEIRSARAFRAGLDRGRGRLMAVANEIAGLVAQILDEYRALLAEREAVAGSGSESHADIDTQLAHLVYRGFVGATTQEPLQALPRYLKAIRLRVRKLGADPARDARKILIIAPRWQRCVERLDRHRERGILDPELTRYRWMLEELRVSLFAQEVGTAHPVSVQRLDQQWGKVRP